MEKKIQHFPPGMLSAQERRVWWESLAMMWKHLFLECMFQRNPLLSDVTDDDLCQLGLSTVLRVVGHGGMHPNFSGSIPDLNGLERLTNIEYLFVMYCGLESLDGIQNHVEMKSLFVQGNKLVGIGEIKKMAKLQELYISNNAIESIAPVKSCKMLQTLYCENNQLTSLDGIKPFHEKHLQMLKCKPNEKLPQRELIRVQNTYGILCQ